MAGADYYRASMRADAQMRQVQAITYDAIAKRLTIVIDGYIFSKEYDENTDAYKWSDLFSLIADITNAPLTTEWDDEN